MRFESCGKGEDIDYSVWVTCSCVECVCLVYMKTASLLLTVHLSHQPIPDDNIPSRPALLSYSRSRFTIYITIKRSATPVSCRFKSVFLRVKVEQCVLWNEKAKHRLIRHFWVAEHIFSARHIHRLFPWERHATRHWLDKTTEKELSDLSCSFL